MTNEQAGEKFVKTVTNERVLFSWRTIVLVLSVSGNVIMGFIQGGVSDIKASIIKVESQVADLDRRFNLNQINTIDRLGKVEGQVGELKGSVETHRGRLTDIDNDRRAMWQRLYEMSRSRLNPTPKPDTP